MTMRLAPSRLAGYARISKDDPKSVSIESQISKGDTYAAERGWPAPVWFIDDGISASVMGKRPEFDRLIEEVGNGQWDGVLCRDDDRLARHPMELETIMPVFQKGTGTPVYFTDASDLDLTTPDGRAFARIKGALARGEVEKKALRQKGNNEKRAAMGQPYGPGLDHFGFRKSGDTLTQVPAQAEAIRWAADELLAGATRAHVARTWNAKGHRTGRGTPWGSPTVKWVMSSPVIAGRRAYRPTSILSEEVQPAQMIDGNWEPIIPWSKFQALQTVLEPTRSNSAGNRVSYLGSGIYRCGDCPDPTPEQLSKPARRVSDGRANLPTFRTAWAAWTTKGNPRKGTKPEKRRLRTYLCQSCGLTIRGADEIDAHVEALARQFLRWSHVHVDVFGAPDPEADRDLDAERRDLEDREATLAEAVANGFLRRQVFEEKISDVRARLQEIERLEAEEAREHEELSIFRDAAKAAEQWDAASIEVKRTALKRIFPRVNLYPSRRYDGLETFVEVLPPLTVFQLDNDGRMVAVSNPRRLTSDEVRDLVSRQRIGRFQPKRQPIEDDDRWDLKWVTEAEIRAEFDLDAS